MVQDARLPGSLAAVQEEPIPVLKPTAMGERLMTKGLRSLPKWQPEPIFLDSRRLPGRCAPLNHRLYRIERGATQVRGTGPMEIEGWNGIGSGATHVPAPTAMGAHLMIRCLRSLPK